MALEALSPFSLVGGTALALRYGHRSSVDLDLFFHERFDYKLLAEELNDKFGDDFEQESGHKQFGLFCYVKKVKVDIVYYPYVPIDDIEVTDTIRMYGSKDICAMKVQAMLGRGRKKDFWDLQELLRHYSLAEMIAFHKQKYPSQMLAISIPNAITYFTDAEESEDPVSFKGQTWNSVKKGIQKAVRDYLI
jgi:predicted nucleotidyltransferase component of viral defense system